MGPDLRDEQRQKDGYIRFFGKIRSFVVHFGI